MAERSFSELVEIATEAARALDAPLSVRLKAVAETIEQLSPEFGRIVDQMVSRLADNGVGLSAPSPGERMPEFVLSDETGRLVSLSQLLDTGPVVVSFNRGHWCPYCRLNVDALTKAQPQIASLGAQIVAVSPETSKWNAELKAYANAPFRILSDLDGAYALELNLLFWLGEQMAAALMAGGFDLTLFQGNATWMLPIPATFVVARDGIIRTRHIDPDYRHRMEIDDLIQAVRCAESDQSKE
jgi:peroxiredoxin